MKRGSGRMPTCGGIVRSIRSACASGETITSCAAPRGYRQSVKAVATMPGIEFSEIARLLSCEEFARHEMQLRGKRAQCPFHGGKNFNLAFYPKGTKDGKCFCFKCGRAADVVQLAAAVWHTDLVTAANMLNDEYHLGLTSSTPTDEQRQCRQREREQRESDAQRQREQWARAADDLREAEQAAGQFTIADADNPSTWAAIARLSAAQDKWAAMRAGVSG